MYVSSQFTFLAHHLSWASLLPHVILFAFKLSCTLPASHFTSFALHLSCTSHFPALHLSALRLSWSPSPHFRISAFSHFTFFAHHPSCISPFLHATFLALNFFLHLTSVGFQLFRNMPFFAIHLSCTSPVLSFTSPARNFLYSNFLALFDCTSTAIIPELILFLVLHLLLHLTFLALHPFTML